MNGGEGAGGVLRGRILPLRGPALLKSVLVVGPGSLQGAGGKDGSCVRVLALGRGYGRRQVTGGASGQDDGRVVICPPEGIS